MLVEAQNGQPVDNVDQVVNPGATSGRSDDERAKADNPEKVPGSKRTTAANLLLNTGVLSW